MDEPVPVEALARAAHLELSPERVEIVSQILAEWRPGCLDLNRKMSEPMHRHRVPVTVFVHAAVDGDRR